MKLGLGLYRHMLTAENFRFARQCGCTHVVAHLVDYFHQGEGNRENQPVGSQAGWGRAGAPDKLWTYDELKALKGQISDHGLQLYAIENLDPAHWHDVLLNGPRKALHLENVKTILRNLGRAGIPVLGYNFSLAGVGGRIQGPFARGGRSRWAWRGRRKLRFPTAWSGTWFTILTRRPEPCPPSRARNCGAVWQDSSTR